ncbi:hypothetical protein ACFVYF_35740 [Streptomyces sp. NPDC058274]|uniref:hypothetical protein n=1 Tax=Streptomyces sp. NPDC058274 TaxID=3346416 RepID=UPI0036EE5602
MAALATGCSNDPAKSQPEGAITDVAASKVCDGALDASAAAALQRLSGTDRFDERVGTNDAGEPNTFSLDRAVKHLHGEYLKRSACWVYKSGDESGQPLFEVRFSASLTYPSGSGKESEDDRVRYHLGVYAVAGRNGADMFFRCPTNATTNDAYVGNTNYVKAEMFSVTSKMRGDNVNKDRMMVLNSMSRKVAAKAGCASQAALPSQVPEAEAD